MLRTTDELSVDELSADFAAIAARGVVFGSNFMPACEAMRYQKSTHPALPS
jgi:hypothetical protein